MNRILARLERLEARAPLTGHDRVTAVERVFVNPDGSPATKPDGSPAIISREIGKT